MLNTSRSAGATTSSTQPTGSLTPVPTWSIVKSNLTVYYGTACVPVEFSYLSCPTEDVAAHSPSLAGVDLVRYQGDFYYDINFTFYINGQPTTHTIWFTNSTVFCASPVVPNSGVGPCPTQPSQPKTFVLVGTSATATNSSLGLRLGLNISIDSSSEGNLRIGIEERNVLNHMNNVTVANDWRIPTSNLYDVRITSIVGFAVYWGAYGLDNFTSGTPLALIEPGVSFNNGEPSPPTYYSFQPMSDVATLSSGTFLFRGTSTTSISFTDEISGYWTGGPSNSEFNVFPPGNYTIVALDQWGQVALLHFAVVETSQAVPLTFNYASLPSQFTVGGYIVTVAQGTDYEIETGNGTSYEYLGFYTVFVIAHDNQTQTAPFFWNTPYGPSTSHPPYNGTCMAENDSTNGCPFSANLFGGGVSITWTERNSTAYVTFVFNSTAS